MTFKSNHFKATASSKSLDKKQQLHQALQDCRIGTLALFEGLDHKTFCQQAHPDFSPIGWHLGHIAYTEAYWILERCAGFPPAFPQYHRLFAADGLPKAERANLPSFTEVCDYLGAVRSRVLSYLETITLDNSQERLWSWLLQHESQHGETIALVLQLQRWQSVEGGWVPEIRHHLPDIQEHGSERYSSDSSSTSEADMVLIPAGYFQQGNDSPDAIDNERPAHKTYLDSYWIDCYAVTCGQYRAFIEAGGYQNSNWWSTAGWSWLQEHPVKQPLYWVDDVLWNHHPVYGVSWYEAEAYANFVGKRLPTESEWEKAASWDSQAERGSTYPWGEARCNHSAGRTYCNHDHDYGHTTPVDHYPAGKSSYGCYDMLGNVWEWTASWFDGYDGFESYLYRGYSQVYFDGQHRVLRGGSWATRPWALRCAFRNWYHPDVRQIFAGFRCAKDAEECTSDPLKDLAQV